jgi:Zn-dependent metalloprotease
VIFALLLAAQTAASFKADFPHATVVETPEGMLTSASGFDAHGLGPSPEAAARAFLEKYGPAFGVTPDQKLVLRDAAPPGKTGGRVRFERRLKGYPIFEADLVLGVNGTNDVILVNTSAVPAQSNGGFAMNKDQGIEAALNAIADRARDPRPRAARGWISIGSSLRPVWRVDLVAGLPQSDWRSYVDAENGKLLLRIDLRESAKVRRKRDLAL